LDNADMVEQLTLPVLFLMGDAERTASPQAVTELVTRIPNAQLTVYEATRHMPFIERRERFNDDLKVFVTTTFAQP